MKTCRMLLLGLLLLSLTWGAQGQLEDKGSSSKTSTPSKTPTVDSAKPDVKAKGQRFEVETLTDLAYVEGKDTHPIKHKLDLYLPKGQKNFPVLFFVHGGSWRSGDKKLYRPLGELFARNGIAVVVPNYRLSPAVKHPAHIEDVAQAFAWTQANIQKHGGRNDQLFVSGHSAGGHLVALLATDEGYLKRHKLGFSHIKGVLALSGVYLILPGVFTAQFGNDAEVCRKASPLNQVNGKHPPFFLAYADKDYPMLGSLAERMAKTLEKTNCEVSIQKIENRDHISILLRMVSQPETDPLGQAMLNFIKARLQSSLPRPKP